ncbi:MAG: hypothetical protein ACTSYD_08885 [Candidatus Heimdallarchaeaceae archaeon]
MSENSNNMSAENETAEKPIFLPSLFTDKDIADLFRELTVILTRKWKKNGIYVYGCSENDLLLSTLLDVASLTELLEEYGEFIKTLGLELRSYQIDEQKWYCLQSSFYAPPELSEVQLIILGTLIGLIETTNKAITTRELKEELVTKGILKEYQVERSLRELEILGYIRRIKNAWQYNYRTLIEFDEESRSLIAKRYENI